MNLELRGNELDCRSEIGRWLCTCSLQAGSPRFSGQRAEITGELLTRWPSKSSHSVLAYAVSLTKDHWLHLLIISVLPQGRWTEWVSPSYDPKHMYNNTNMSFKTNTCIKKNNKQDTVSMCSS